MWVDKGGKIMPDCLTPLTPGTAFLALVGAWLTEWVGCVLGRKAGNTVAWTAMQGMGGTCSLRCSWACKVLVAVSTLRGKSIPVTSGQNQGHRITHFCTLRKSLHCTLRVTTAPWASLLHPEKVTTACFIIHSCTVDGYDHHPALFT